MHSLPRLGLLDASHNLLDRLHDEPAFVSDTLSAVRLQHNRMSCVPHALLRPPHTGAASAASMVPRALVSLTELDCSANAITEVITNDHLKGVKKWAVTFLIIETQKGRADVPLLSGVLFVHIVTRTHQCWFIPFPSRSSLLQLKVLNCILISLS